MRVIIAGGRDICDVHLVLEAIKESGWAPYISVVVSGGARGVDECGKELGDSYGVPVRTFPAAWKKFGPKAGPMRNREMAEYADRLIAVWDGESKGTRNMIEEMDKLKKPVFVFKVKRIPMNIWLSGDSPQWEKA